MENSIKLFCKNDSDKISKCIIFGYREFLSDVNFGSERGIVLRLEKPINKPYVAILSDTKDDSILISSITLLSKDKEQLLRGININERNEDLQSVTIPIRFQNYLEEGEEIKQNDEGEYYINIPFKLTVNKNTFISAEILPNSSFKIELIP